YLFFSSTGQHTTLSRDWISDVCSPDSIKIACDSPGREYERMNSYSPVSISFFSIRSVTWRATSSAVAPGHRVRTTMALKVNGGSSERPSCRYDSAPPIATTIIAYSTRLRLRRAHSDRLKRIAQPSVRAGTRAMGAVVRAQ